MTSYSPVSSVRPSPAWSSIGRTRRSAADFGSLFFYSITSGSHATLGRLPSAACEAATRTRVAAAAGVSREQGGIGS
jgi:hypothetical protein